MEPEWRFWLSDCTTKWTIKDSCFISRLYSPNACSTTTKANQSPIQRVLVVLFPWVKWRLGEADHPPSASDEVKNDWLNRYSVT